LELFFRILVNLDSFQLLSF